MTSSNFPEGGRVLVIIEDTAYFQELKTCLEESRYEVTRCDEEKKAMTLLRDHMIRYTIAVIEVEGSEGDRLRLVSTIGSELKIPIIIMSEDKSPESVLKWLSNAACCDYLVKPITPQDLLFIIFKQVAKIRGKWSEAEQKAACEKSSSVEDSTIRSHNKRIISTCFDAQVNGGDHHYHDRAYASTSKKRRVAWDKELCKKFNDAVEHLGIDNAVPKKILEMMNVENLTRENVASHLQKFRKKQNEEIEREERNRSLDVPRTSSSETPSSTHNFSSEQHENGQFNNNNGYSMKSDKRDSQEKP